MVLDAAREQMVEQQVRAADVLDERILEVMRAVPRERFVPPAWRDLAFADTEIPLPCGKRMLRPMLVGRLLQALEVRDGEQALEIGTGSGFVSACLALLGARVRSMELHPEIAELARANLAAVPDMASVEVVGGDGMGLTAESSYDVLVLTASLPLYQTRFERALRPGGRLFAVVGSANPQQARLVRRTGVRDWNSEILFETVIEALEHAPRPPEFGF
jgi:protein-L-isoaspartate(D-aspartate) O-methyltransferase